MLAQFLQRFKFASFKYANESETDRQLTLHVKLQQFCDLEFEIASRDLKRFE